ncbi:MurR/RpiR family transcriptional regulator [Companilactobacillus huachuanensis]|uniref:MurR/RpiR family transcriptional regulator n=1 Tax=Companilactobacillus huachuanensis TaxID=2559914 RepID=A0ABW1RJD9_9LACO|nr:MurR/RpiR family transcriptional regulator [Companilactobacillus huachuanensis]
MDFDALIQDNYQKLTKSEKKVAKFITDNKKTVIYGTMETIKERIDVGDATIVRFSKKLGFSGFNDLKIALAKAEIAANNTNSDDSTHEYYDDIEDTLITTLKDTNALINKDNVDSAVKLISNAQKLYIFGVGHSGEIGKNFSKMLLRIGLIVQAETDPHFQAQMASIMTKNNLVIGISLSGETKDTYDSLTIAKKSGAKIISITNSSLSAIAQISDITLQTSIEEFLNGGSLAGQLSQLYLCEVLLRGYERQNNIDVLAIREKGLRSIMNKKIKD